MDEARKLTLALDTSMPTSSAALLDGADILASRTWEAGRRHSMHLEPNVRAAIGAELEHVGVVAVAAGPGGFSSLRASMAFAKGLCSALNIGFISVSTPLALAHSSPAGAESVLTLILDGSGQYFMQSFERRRIPHPSPLPEGEGTRSSSIEAAGECKLVGDAALHEALSGPVFVAGYVSEGDLDRMRESSKWPVEFGVELSMTGLARFVGLAAHANSQQARPMNAMNAMNAVPQYMRDAGITAPVRGWGKA